jgi:cytochrome c biogenesis protein CcdA
MPIYLLAFVGGVLTILSPCILPVLPFVFAGADQPFRGLRYCMNAASLKFVKQQS